ncbi:MAG TPA: sigma 54-interacting transcriptional regulator [Polyangiaceae bacterium]
MSIRSLRGSLTRAEFARRLGVTPNTVYRWELPETATEARRPRGADLNKLRDLLVQAKQLATSKQELPVATDVQVHRGPWTDDDLSLVLPALERVLRGDSRKGHGELLALFTRGRGLSRNARALASFGIALFELLQRADARSALLAIAQPLADAESGLLEPGVTTKVFAVVALLHTETDASLFDLGRVHAYAARVESAAGNTDPEAGCVAWLASMRAAFFVADRDSLERGFARLDEATWQDLPPLLALHVEEFRMKAMLAGRTGLSCRHFEVIAERAEQLGYSLLHARALGHMARSELDRLGAPQAVLTLARRAKQVAMLHRPAPGQHDVLAIRAEVEALLRMGNATEALTAATALDDWWHSTGIAPLHAITVRTRLLHLTGRIEELNLLAQQLDDCTIPSLRPIYRAYAAYVRAVASLYSVEDGNDTVAAFDRAEELALGWPFLLREIRLKQVTAQIVSGDPHAARLALHRAQRFVAQFHSAWVTTFLRRLEGGILTAVGSWNEGRRLIESAAATFELGGDVCDAALARHTLMRLANVFGESGAAEGLEQTRVELVKMGIQQPCSLDKAVARMPAAMLEKHTHNASWSTTGIGRLVVPLQRVSLRGAPPAFVLRELLLVVQGLLPSCSVHIEEIDSAGVSRLILGDAVPLGDVQHLEFGDGAGRLFRLGVAGSLDDEGQQVLSILTTAASLALETATLRSFGEAGSTGTPDEELPGFIATAPATRALRAELIRLKSSRSTVIITGESGVGKELVARAIHDLSERRGQPYVAFNCAAVPRDLFEGQLFGYRRGAFTGAVSDQPGVIRSASGGTLFLDEIGELPLDVQPKLLRLLENSEVFPLGERRPIHVDVRILAATHRDLGALVHEGRFREDLYYRLQVVPIFVPPLRERRDDIAVLARHFVSQLCPTGDPPVLAPDAIAALTAHPWPGNVRELRNVIERALAFSPTPAVLRAEHLRLDRVSAPSR